MSSKAEQAEVISSNIKKLREGKGWNQTKLASEASISGAALSKIEQGNGRVPTIVVMRKIASALKVQVNDITGEATEVTSEAEERNREFYRKWDVLDDLEQSDQEILRGMAERLKGITQRD
ncbi:Helix-turn-helix motif protein [Shewanella piezotolerans WP3]|uniref:Helix-turn-helix motif protein n=1 Tax=Shewanella piezotolerans (strain WP3 / JCM 13877) TaxID=225849 RepID=B8CUD5_SHEPW|nr:helix-turn-helix transcriptional regulator [Shewanella piezotolerans]ACJ31127.1 Helix-turn-helix motif protein [Shewanella piezotolerans WP3]